MIPGPPPEFEAFWLEGAFVSAVNEEFGARDRLEDVGGLLSAKSHES
jgi:hypothetical protein